jgi:hypothetical protein
MAQAAVRHSFLGCRFALTNPSKSEFITPPSALDPMQFDLTFPAGIEMIRSSREMLTDEKTCRGWFNGQKGP